MRRVTIFIIIEFLMICAAPATKQPSQYLNAAMEKPASTEEQALCDTIVAAFNRGDYRDLDTKIGVILREKKNSKDGQSLLSKAYNAFLGNRGENNSLETKRVQFEDWLAANPNSHFANGVTGSFYVTYAWNARGGGFANALTETGRRLFQERLLQARDYLEKAYQVDPSDAIVPAQLIKVEMGLGASYSEMEKQFQRAVQADCREYTAYKAKLTYLMPKWHGSIDMMFSFARDAALNAPSDSLVPLILAQAHWEMYANSEDKRFYFRQPKVWEEVKSAYSLIFKRFPEANERRNWFARAAWLAGDLEMAKEQFAIIGNDWSQEAWGSFPEFAKAKAETLSN